MLELQINGKAVPENKIVSLTYTDETGRKNDKLTFTLPEKYKPNLGDGVSAVIDGKMNCGKFTVSRIQADYVSQTVSVSATSVNWDESMKIPRNRSFSDMTIAEIAKQIAKEHGLKCVSDSEELRKYVAQNFETDLQLLQRLADSTGLVFNIKDGTVVLVANPQKKKSEKIDASKCNSLETEETGRKNYGTVSMSWNDTKTNTTKNVTIGDTEPTFHTEGAFSNEAEALTRAVAVLKQLREKQMSGSLEIRGFPFFAGQTLQLSNTDRTFTSESVTHKVDPQGWTVRINFNLLEL